MQAEPFLLLDLKQFLNVTKAMPRTPNYQVRNIIKLCSPQIMSSLKPLRRKQVASMLCICLGGAMYSTYSSPASLPLDATVEAFRSNAKWTRGAGRPTIIRSVGKRLDTAPVSFWNLPQSTDLAGAHTTVVHSTADWSAAFLSRWKHAKQMMCEARLIPSVQGTTHEDLPHKGLIPINFRSGGGRKRPKNGLANADERGTKSRPCLIQSEDERPVWERMSDPTADTYPQNHAQNSCSGPLYGMTIFFGKF
ncbi:hypothetical protein DFH09DRAFT_1290140 [Mycena vulgaris]|nr:hypothetical protein DFH09DRAFT_1290140 [Mycena vulgaris]